MLSKQFPYIAAQKRTLAVSCDFMNVIFVCLLYDIFFKTMVNHIVYQICNEVKCPVKVRLVRETMFYKNLFITVTPYSIL